MLTQFLDLMGNQAFQGVFGGDLVMGTAEFGEEDLGSGGLDLHL